jgi:hypothetical protein
VNIEEFYDENEARRESAEYEFGSEWSDDRGRTFELSWVEATGELYLMADPDAEVTEDTFGDVMVLDEPMDALAVRVLAVIPTHDEVETHLAGWQSAMTASGSLAWLVSHVPSAGA